MKYLPSILYFSLANRASRRNLKSLGEFLLALFALTGGKSIPFEEGGPYSLLGFICSHGEHRHNSLVATATLPIQPPHAANRHNAGCGGAGGDCMGGEIRELRVKG